MNTTLRNHLKSLSIDAVESSTEIHSWLSQFSEDTRITAKTMLYRLKFVSRDVYSEWLSRVIGLLPLGKNYALYSVRKLDEEALVLWGDDGIVVDRPGVSQGSEDLVYSLVANLVRSSSGSLLDHPSLTDLRTMRIRDYVLIDDSIGSGDRVSSFINAMLNHPTFLSWWSFGFVKIHVFSFARQRDSGAKIIANIRGSDHYKRVHRKSSKIEFISEIVYDTGWLEARWGENYEQIINLCSRQIKVPKWARLGYGEVMANIVFYHSVPNNLPGVLWYKCNKWNGLFPDRALPNWFLAFLDAPSGVLPVNNLSLSQEMVRLLALVKRGIRSSRSIAVRLGVDHKYAEGLLSKALSLGLLSSEIRLTSTGFDRLKQAAHKETLHNWDRSLYIPSSWCVGHATIQPPVSGRQVPQAQADSVEVSALTDGDVGQTSLERSDAKAAMPPFSAMLQLPAVSRMNHDTDGPKGSKER